MPRRALGRDKGEHPSADLFPRPRAALSAREKQLLRHARTQARKRGLVLSPKQRRALRLRQAMTVEEIAEVLAVEPRTVQRWLRKWRSPELWPASVTADAPRPTVVIAERQGKESER